MKSFVISDHHFGAWKNKISNFKVLAKNQENEAILKWNSIVKQEDLVYYVGDFHDSNVIDLIEYRQKLNGNIVLIKGNHDILPKETYKTVFNDVVDKIQVDSFWLRHIPYDDGRKQIYGHLHKGYEKNPYMIKNGFCACASFHNYIPIEIKMIENSLQPF